MTILLSGHILITLLNSHFSKLPRSALRFPIFLLPRSDFRFLFDPEIRPRFIIGNRSLDDIRDQTIEFDAPHLLRFIEANINRALGNTDIRNLFP